MARRRHAGWRAIKIHRNYTVDEVARVLGYSKGTVRRWLKTGLPAITDRKPALILGPDLIDFLRTGTKAKRKCGLDECYCLKCRTPRKAAGGLADLIMLTSTGGNLQALCVECGTVMHKRVSRRHFDALTAILDLSIREGR